MASSENIKNWSVIVSAIAVPIILGVFTYNQKDRELDIKMMELSVSILAKEPTHQDSLIRVWAVDVLNKYSTVELPLELQRKMIDSVSINFLTTAKIWAESYNDAGNSGQPFP